MTTTNHRRNAYAILSDLKDSDLRVILVGDEPIKMESLIRAQKLTTRLQAIAAEVAGDLSAIKAEMLAVKSESDDAVGGAIDKMIDSGDLELDDEPASAPLAARNGGDGARP